VLLLAPSTSVHCFCASTPNYFFKLAVCRPPSTVIQQLWISTSFNPTSNSTNYPFKKGHIPDCNYCKHKINIKIADLKNICNRFQALITPRLNAEAETPRTILIEIASLLLNLYGPRRFTALTQRGPITDNDSFIHITGCPRKDLSRRERVERVDPPCLKYFSTLPLH